MIFTSPFDLHRANVPYTNSSLGVTLVWHSADNMVWDTLRCEGDTAPPWTLPRHSPVLAFPPVLTMRLSAARCQVHSSAELGRNWHGTSFNLGLIRCQYWLVYTSILRYRAKAGLSRSCIILAQARSGAQSPTYPLLYWMKEDHGKLKRQRFDHNLSVVYVVILMYWIYMPPFWNNTLYSRRPTTKKTITKIA